LVCFRQTFSRSTAIALAGTPVFYLFINFVFDLFDRFFSDQQEEEGDEDDVGTD
jgi:hypothetical protein